MPRVMLVGFGPYPGCPANPSQEIVETLRAERWSPPEVRLSMIVAPCLWWRGADVALAFACREKPDAVVLLGHAPGAETMIAAASAQNAAGVAPDASGLRWPGKSLAPAGPHRLEATLPARSLARVMAAGDAPAIEAADGGDFVWNRCLYTLLAQESAARIGLILAPTPLETARGLGRMGPAALNRGQLLAGVQAAIRWAAALAARAEAAA